MSTASSTEKTRSSNGLKLAGVFTDHIVLQRDMPVPVWGTADAGETVTVAFRDQIKHAIADISGNWMLRLDPVSSTFEPNDLVVAAGDHSVKLSDVLVGEVWLASGQSNMAAKVSECRDAAHEIATADRPLLRVFNVHGLPSMEPRDTFDGQWAASSPQTIGEFSAAGYYFGREIQQALNVPVGVINSSWGGTPAEAWTQLGALKTVPWLSERADREIALMRSKPDDDKRYSIELAAWQTSNGVTPPSIAEFAKTWAEPAMPTADWKAIKLPGAFSQAGFKRGGIFWVRRDVQIPEAVANETFIVWLKLMDEEDNRIYWNGVEVGKEEFRYVIPQQLVKAGRNVLAIRLACASEKTIGNRIDAPVPGANVMDDQWLVKQEFAFPPISDGAIANRPRRNTSDIIQVSSALYNGMINPLIPFAIRGAIWYQGESNCDRASEYRNLLSLMISDWRERWGQGNFPFIIQQLPDFGAPSTDVNQPGTWPWIREAQSQVAETLPFCKLSVGIGLGEGVEIHPRNKQEIGKRFALVTMEQVYGVEIRSSGPRYESMKVTGSSIRITFKSASGLHCKNADLKYFAIAGANQKFFWADARIDGESVIVSSSQVSKPVAVRYAFVMNPEGCNLTNGSGLPSSPFRTDTW